MTAPLDPALTVSLAHEARRHRPLPLDWSAPTIAGPRWYDLSMLEDAAACVLILAGLAYIALELT